LTDSDGVAPDWLVLVAVAPGSANRVAQAVSASAKQNPDRRIMADDDRAHDASIAIDFEAITLFGKWECGGAGVTGRAVNAGDVHLELSTAVVREGEQFAVRAGGGILWIGNAGRHRDDVVPIAGCQPNPNQGYAIAHEH
jgi:hypothetical protein